MKLTLPRAMTVVRIGVATLIGIHAFTRTVKGTIPDLGQFLHEQGVPFAAAVAVAITAFEMTATASLALGRFVPVACAGLIAILSTGIAMVHARDGWFVVGGGRNGVEYSVLLLVCLLALVVDARRETTA